MVDFINPQDLQAFWVTIKLAVLTTAILLVIGLPVAWWLAHTRSKVKIVVEAIVALPLILPPTVLGFYLLLLLGANSPVGAMMQTFGLQPLAFTFAGLVIGSIFYSLPFVVQPLQNAFSAIGSQTLEVALTLRASKLDRFVTVVLPIARPGIITGAVLGFAHTLGEFGVVLMIGGNIPGETRVLSIAIYDHVEAMEYAQAHWLAGSLLFLSFILLIFIYGLNRRFTLVNW